MSKKKNIMPDLARFVVLKDMARAVMQDTRMAILKKLYEDGKQTVTQLIELTGEDQSVVSSHLKKLRDAGLVENEKTGKYRHYYVSKAHFHALIEWVERMPTNKEG